MAETNSVHQTALPVASGQTSTAIPAGKFSNADKLWKWLLNDAGINWISRQTVRTWYAAAARHGGRISRDELKDLFGGRIGFFRKLFNPSQKAYVIDITEKAWDAFLGDADGDFDETKDAITCSGSASLADSLIERLTAASAMGAAQGKSLRQLFESKRIIWVDKEDASRGCRSYLKQLVRRRIQADSEVPADQKEEFTKKANEYIDNGDIVKLFQNEDLGPLPDQPGRPRPYQYLDEESMKSHFIRNIYDAYQRTEGLSGNPKARVATMYSVAGLNSFFNDGYSIKTVYEAERGMFDPDAYDTVEDIMETIRKLSRKVEEIKGRIAAGGDTRKIGELRGELEKTQELLKLSRRFFRFACIFGRTGGTNYRKAVEDRDHRVNPEKARGLTLRDWVRLFKDPEKILEMLEERPPKEPEPQQENLPPVPVEAQAGSGPAQTQSHS